MSVLRTTLRLAALLLLAALPLQAGRTADPRPRVFLEYSTRGAPLDLAQVRMEVDGEDVTAAAEVSGSMVSWRPREPLAAGEHRVRVQLADARGGRTTKEWSFTVDAAAQVPPFTLSLRAPTPANGAVATAPEVPVAVEVGGVPAADLDLALFLAEGGGFQGRAEPFTLAGNVAKAVLCPGRDGPKTLLVRARHRASGQEREVQSGFLLDRRPPAVAAVEVDPLPVPLDPQRPVHVFVSFRDEPADAAAVVALTVEGPEGRSLRLEQTDATSWADLEIPASRLAGWPAGCHPLQVLVRDYGGHEAREPAPAFLEIRAGADGLPRPAPYPQVTREAAFTMRGQGVPLAAVALRRSEATLAAGHCLLDGSFLLEAVPLEEGLNELRLSLGDAQGRLLGPERPAPSVLRDSLPPVLASFSPAAGTALDEPRPLFSWRLTDAGAGLDAGRVELLVDGRPCRVEAAEDGGFAARPATELAPGAREVLLRAPDRAGNVLESRRQVLARSGPPQDLEVACGRREIHAWGSDHAVVRVALRDRFGRPVDDGTPVSFRADRGLAPGAMGTVGGAVEARYYPGLRLGKARLTVSAGGEAGAPRLERVLEFDVVNAPQRGPVRAAVEPGRPAAAADGKTRLDFTVRLLDALDQPVLDGLPVSVAAALGAVDPASGATAGGGAFRFAYRPGRRCGPETITLTQGEFRHQVAFELSPGPSGPPARIEAEPTPSYAEAGSPIPVRLVARVFDDAGNPAEDGTAVAFGADRGSLPAQGRTARGAVINDYLAPAEPGRATITLRAGNAATEVALEVIPRPAPAAVARLWTDLPARWAPGDGAKAVLAVHGQLHGARDELLPGTRTVFVLASRGRAPLEVLAHGGVFAFDYVPSGAGAVDLEFHHGATVLRRRLEVDLPAGAAPVEARDLPAGLRLDLSYQAAARSGDLESGLLAVRLGGAAVPAALANAPLALTASRGEILARAFLEGGALTVPLSFRREAAPVEVEAHLEAFPSVTGRLAVDDAGSGPVGAPAGAPTEAPPEGWTLIRGDPGPGGVPLVLRRPAGLEPPAPLVRFTARRGSCEPPALRAWDGVEARILYRPPEEGDSDLVVAECGTARASLVVPVLELRQELLAAEPAAERAYGAPAQAAARHGLKAVVVSGDTSVQAGGRDRTRLRLRLLDERDRPLPEGTPVELSCPQAKLSTTRAEIRREEIVLTVQGRDWIGAYPLVLKAGDLEARVPLLFTVPPDAGNPLPAFPRGPDFRLPRMPGPPAPSGGDGSRGR